MNICQVLLQDIPCNEEMIKYYIHNNIGDRVKYYQESPNQVMFEFQTILSDERIRKKLQEFNVTSIKYL